MEGARRERTVRTDRPDTDTDPLGGASAGSAAAADGIDIDEIEPCLSDASVRAAYEQLSDRYAGK